MPAEAMFLNLPSFQRSQFLAAWAPMRRSYRESKRQHRQCLGVGRRAGRGWRKAGLTRSGPSATRLSGAGGLEHDGSHNFVADFGLFEGNEAVGGGIECSGRGVDEGDDESSERPALISLMTESLLSACCAASRGQIASNTTARKLLRMRRLVPFRG